MPFRSTQTPAGRAPVPFIKASFTVTSLGREYSGGNFLFTNGARTSTIKAERTVPARIRRGFLIRRLFYHENLSSVCPSYFRAGSGSAGPDRLLCGWKRRAGRQAARPAQEPDQKRGDLCFVGSCQRHGRHPAA